MLVTLKNRSRPQTEDEKDWYEKAFGSKRNIMKYTVLYKPQNEAAKKGKLDIYAKITFQMFPEMIEEFPGVEPYQVFEREMEGYEDDLDRYEYELELDFPYGSVSHEILCRPKQKGEEENEVPLQPVLDSEKDFIFTYYEPKPISQEEQKLLDEQEE